MYRPDLLFQQQYPTRYGRKVTRCLMPSDKTPTVTRLASEPQGNDVSASTRRRWGRMHGMVNTCELVTVHLMKTGITPQLVIASHRQEGETGPLRHAGRLHGRR